MPRLDPKTASPSRISRRFWTMSRSSRSPCSSWLFGSPTTTSARSARPRVWWRRLEACGHPSGWSVSPLRLDTPSPATPSFRLFTMPEEGSRWRRSRPGSTGTSPLACSSSTLKVWSSLRSSSQPAASRGFRSRLRCPRSTPQAAGHLALRYHEATKHHFGDKQINLTDVSVKTD